MSVLLSQRDKDLLLSVFGLPEVSDKMIQLLTLAGADGGSGDVVGPASSIANRIPLFDGITGKLLKQSTISVDSFSNVLFATDGTGDIGSADGGSTFNRPLGIYVGDTAFIATMTGETGSVFVGAGGAKLIGDAFGITEIQAGIDGVNGAELFLTTQAGDIGGAISVLAGGSSDNGQDAPIVNVQAGEHVGSGKGGIVTIKAGNSASGDGGDIEIYAGTGSTNGAIKVIQGDLQIFTAGKGLAIQEGANARMGIATLTAGTLTVNTTSVTADSRIFLTQQNISGVSVATAVAVSARSAGVSFTISSANVLDTSDVAWCIIEPV